ncbi:MAG: hypothetical protein AAF432_06920 [Planctomycetota bacterium]
MAILGLLVIVGGYAILVQDGVRQRGWAAAVPDVVLIATARQTADLYQLSFLTTMPNVVQSDLDRGDRWRASWSGELSRRVETEALSDRELSWLSRIAYNWLEEDELTNPTRLEQMQLVASLIPFDNKTDAGETIRSEDIGADARKFSRFVWAMIIVQKAHEYSLLDNEATNNFDTQSKVAIVAIADVRSRSQASVRIRLDYWVLSRDVRLRVYDYHAAKWLPTANEFLGEDDEANLKLSFDPDNRKEVNAFIAIDRYLADASTVPLFARDVTLTVSDRPAVEKFELLDCCDPEPQ